MDLVVDILLVLVLLACLHLSQLYIWYFIDVRLLLPKDLAPSL